MPERRLAICRALLLVLFPVSALTSPLGGRAQERSDPHAGLTIQPELRGGVPVRPSSANSYIFFPAATYSSGASYASSVAVADVNGDGKADLVVANLCVSNTDCPDHGVVSVLLGNGNGTFGAAQTYSSGGRSGYLQQEPFEGGWTGPNSIVVGDVNGDGKPDLIVANWCVSSTDCTDGSVGVLLGNGDGTFQAAQTFVAPGNLVLSVAIGDVNGDGKPDLIAASCDDSNVAVCPYGVNGLVSVLLGNGDGTFQPAVTYSSGAQGASSLAVADVNGDGKLDLLVANYCIDCETTSLVGVLMGNGDGTFQPAVTYSTGELGANSIAVADVNADGKLDIVVANECLGSTCRSVGVAGVLLGNGDGTFKAPKTYQTGPAILSIAVADVNGDGKPDLLLSGAGVAVLYGNGNGTFQAAQTYGAGGSGNAMSIAVADVNGDGRPDVVVANYWASTADMGGGVSVLLQGNPSSTSLVSSLNPSHAGQAVTFTATVTSTQGVIPNGELVTFYNGMSQLASVPLSGGVASYTTAGLPAGTDTIGAFYAGDSAFVPSSNTVKQVVNLWTTTTTLSSNSSASKYGQPVTLTAQVTSAGSTVPTGKVTFKNGTATLGSGTLNANASASLTTTKIPLGANTLTATYNGDALNSKSTSPPITQTVSQASLTMALTSAPNPSTLGKPVTFTAALSSDGGFPSGQSVTFSYNGTALGTATVNSKGVAKLTTTTLPRGSDVVTAAYAGTADYSSASATVTQVVN